MKTLIQEAGALRERILSVRRRIHRLAECGMAVGKTAALITEVLQGEGYAVRPAGDCGITAELAAKDKVAPVILLRADMDALPIREDTRRPFRAENGAMHACGHDMHAAMLTGAACLLKKREGTLPFRIRFAFEGAEETLSGAKEMLAAGILSDVRAAAMVHVIPAIPLPTGTVLLPQAGIGAPAALFFRIDVRGRAAHVGERERGEDALALAVRLYRRMEGAAESLGPRLSLSVGVLRAGDAPNILPAHAYLSGSFRSRDEGAFRRFGKTLSRLVKESAGATLSYLGDCPPLENDGTLLSLLKERLPALGFGCVTPERGAGAAAEDFAHFAARVPAVCLGLAAGEAGRGYEHPLHHPAVLFDEDALPTGAALYAATAMSLGEALPAFTNSPTA